MTEYSKYAINTKWKFELSKKKGPAKKNLILNQLFTRKIAYVSLKLKTFINKTLTGHHKLIVISFPAKIVTLLPATGNLS